MTPKASVYSPVVQVFFVFYLNHPDFYTDFLHYIYMSSRYKKQKYLKENEQTSLVFISKRKQRAGAKLIPFVTI